MAGAEGTDLETATGATAGPQRDEEQLERLARWDEAMRKPPADPFVRAMQKPDNAMSKIVFANNAGIDDRVRNEMVTESYGFFAWAIGDLIFPDGTEGDKPPDPNAAWPNFYNYAQWGSFTVGKNLRRRWLPLARRRAIALEDGNADVFHTMGSSAVEFLRLVGELAAECQTSGRGWSEVVDEHLDAAGAAAPELQGASSHPTFADRQHGPNGIPPAIVSRVGRSVDEAERDVLDAIRDQGFACFLEAVAPELSLKEKRSLVLRGTAWLAVSEQAGVEEAVAASLRVNVRRLLTPPWRQLHSERWWRNQPVGPTRMGIENWSVRFLSRFLVWYHPSDVLTKRSATLIARRFNKRDSGEIRATFEQLGEPFCYFAPTVPDRLSAWASLHDRLCVIFDVIVSSFDDDWHVVNAAGERVPRTPRPYHKQRKLLDRYQRHVLTPPVRCDGTLDSIGTARADAA